MWPNPKFLVTFTEGILNEKFVFLCTRYFAAGKTWAAVHVYSKKYWKTLTLMEKFGQNESTFLDKRNLGIVSNFASNIKQIWVN